MDLEDHPDSSQGADQNSSKGKGVAVGYAGRDGKRRSLHSDRKYNLNARRPVITLRKDSGWDFSQDAFVRPSFCLLPLTWHPVSFLGLFDPLPRSPSFSFPPT